MAAWIQSAFRVRQGLSEGDTPTLTGLLSSVYRRVGWEMGVVKRVLEAGRVNWGYFFDHNPFEPHCNAHPNNFIVLPPVNTCVHTVLALSNFSAHIFELY